jgi:hypothetical protein
MRLEPSDTTQSRKVKIIKCNKCKKPYSSGEYTYMCRLHEWKRKKAICPYDSKITSIIRASRDKTQTNLEEK